MYVLLLYPNIVGLNASRRQSVTSQSVRRPCQSVVLVTGPTATFPRKIKLDPYKPVMIRAFVNESLVECFINDAYAFFLQGQGVRRRATWTGEQVWQGQGTGSQGQDRSIGSSDGWSNAIL